MERLEPFEKLECDYYLDDKGGWYSDCENNSSDSSDDDFRERVARLAGIRFDCRKKRGNKKVENKDEFESDMDSELDQQFVDHTSKNVFSSSLDKISTGSLDSQTSDLKAIAADEQIQVNKPNENENRLFNPILKIGTKKAAQLPSTSSRKMVSINDCPEIIGSLEVRERLNESKQQSSFDDQDNILRKAVDKIRKGCRTPEFDFYDPNEDDDNEKWIYEQRKRMKVITSRYSLDRLGCGDNSDNTNGPSNKLPDSDAVLSCPACMCLLTRDCQRHELFPNQYRAMFVENCKVISDQMLFLPTSDKIKKGKRNSTDPMPNTFVANINTIPKEDLFRPVQCSVCNTNVGVFDFDEVFHFFNVLSGYA